MKSEVPDEKPNVLREEKAIETGNFEERIVLSQILLQTM
jgi:hypothetical protein